MRIKAQCVSFCFGGVVFYFDCIWLVLKLLGGFNGCLKAMAFALLAIG
jgi:hypothetical protein